MTLFTSSWRHPWRHSRLCSPYPWRFQPSTWRQWKSGESAVWWPCWSRRRWRNWKSNCDISTNWRPSWIGKGKLWVKMSQHNYTNSSYLYFYCFLENFYDISRRFTFWYLAAYVCVSFHESFIEPTRVNIEIHFLILIWCVLVWNSNWTAATNIQFWRCVREKWWYDLHFSCLKTAG